MTVLFRSGLTALVLVLAAPGAAFAQCAGPNYRGGRELPSGPCPSEAAGTASATVWLVLVLAVLVWLALARRHGRATTEADLALVDAEFSAATRPEVGSSVPPLPSGQFPAGS
ncbi:hypothetical protein ABT160_35490 [Streptomyces sp. NPDC001941]|uniref:hypothetical protein n=1 Tax=Streptomyces sp. NPDC001941 TaxID=3154659 RepID=UPI00332566B9